jgi:predicted RNA-binding Zn-ribbon protein involved in translation (DUF1610 family)
MPSRLLIRPCPVCGIAMQAKKSRDDRDTYDIFECQYCETVIRETTAPDLNEN